MAFDVSPPISFDWPIVVECAQQPRPDLPKAVPQVGQPTDEFLRNYTISENWGRQVLQTQQCKIALAAWMAGWEAGHAGKPNDPTEK